MYDVAMERIRSQGDGCDELAKTILLWIVHALRPLSVRELQHALAVQPNADTIDEDDIPSIKTILSICAGLVTIDEESSVIRLVHYTTQEYFIETRDRWFQDVQQRITKSCVTYLAFRDFDGPCHYKKDFQRRLDMYPFCKYAAQNWGHHARMLAACPEVVRFLEKKAQVQAASQTLNDMWPLDGNLPSLYINYKDDDSAEECVELDMAAHLAWHSQWKRS